MAFIITRRESLRLTAAGIAAAALPRGASAQVPRADVAAPNLPIEKGATLRILRPARFVEPDEVIFGANTGPVVYRKSAVKEAGFDKIPNEHPEFLKLCQALKKANKPPGFALGNAVGDGNGFAQWLIWSHGGALLDEAGKVAINSKETVAALTYLKDLYPTFISGTLSWGDPRYNRAYAAGDVWLTANGVSLYFALKNDPAQRAIAEDTDHQALPFGVASSAPQTATMLNAMLFKHSKFPNAAKSYIQFMMESEQYDS